MSYAPPELFCFSELQKLDVTVRKQLLAVNITGPNIVILLSVTKMPDAKLRRKRHASDHTVHLRENQDFSQLISKKFQPVFFMRRCRAFSYRKRRGQSQACKRLFGYQHYACQHNGRGH